MKRKNDATRAVELVQAERIVEALESIAEAQASVKKVADLQIALLTEATAEKEKMKALRSAGMPGFG